MKQAIHPTYYPDAKVHCSGCDREFTVGSTAREIRVELCSQCHPFYTGKQKLVDTAGRVERFQARAAKAEKKKQERQATQAQQSGANAGTESASAKQDEPTPAERLAAMKQDLENRDR